MEVQVVSQETLEPNLTHIELRISNAGYLGSYGLHAGKSVPHSEPVRLTTTSAEVKVITPPNGKLELGHLGWLGRWQVWRYHHLHAMDTRQRQ
jgi:hypothetical protein